MKTKVNQEKQEAIDSLRQTLKPKQNIYFIIRKVSGSGMLRYMDVYRMFNNEPVCISHKVAQVLGYRLNDKGELRIGGCGMDMTFKVAYDLSIALFRGTDQDTGDSEYDYLLKNQVL